MPPPMTSRSVNRCCVCFGPKRTRWRLGKVMAHSLEGIPHGLRTRATVPDQHGLSEPRTERVFERSKRGHAAAYSASLRARLGGPCLLQSPERSVYTDMS